jgi:transcription elongation factor Elf1
MHHWCHLCNSHLDSENALQEHRERQHFACKTCSATHSNQQELHVHRTSQHHLCQRCDSEHASAVELHHHRVDLHFLCTLCQDQHISQQELDDHRVSAHAWCIPCGRSFQNSNNLKQHQNSKQHKQKSVNCPMKECSASFVSLSALIAHAESGGCVSGVTRREIDRSVVAADINGVITEHRRIMGPAGVSVYPFDQDTKYQATEHAWNGRAFECYLCHRTFRQLKDLNAHLGSSAHTGAHTYHCPPRGCGKTFSTLSSLMRHIEDESCGVRRFRFVERAIEESVGQFSQIKTISSAGRSLVHSSTINSSSRFSPY